MNTNQSLKLCKSIFLNSAFIVGLVPAASFAAPFDFGVKGGFENFLWEEFAADGRKYLDESGTRYVVSGFLGNTLRTKKDFIYRAEAKWYFGTVDYDGETQGDSIPVQTDSNYTGLMAEGEVGYRAGTGSGAFAWDFIGRAGFDYWVRQLDDSTDATGRRVSGITERYTIMNLRLGTGPYWQAGVWQARFVAGFKLPFLTNEYISKDDTGFSDDVNLEPKGRVSTFFNFYNHFRLTKKMLLTFEVFYDSYRFDASDPEVVVDSSGRTIAVWQPESTQDNYGAQAGVSFSF